MPRVGRRVALHKACGCSALRPQRWHAAPPRADSTLWAPPEPLVSEDAPPAEDLHSDDSQSDPDASEEEGAFLDAWLGHVMPHAVERATG
jgi:hypothetical protein